MAADKIRNQTLRWPKAANAARQDAIDQAEQAGEILGQALAALERRNLDLVRIRIKDARRSIDFVPVILKNAPRGNDDEALTVDLEALRADVTAIKIEVASLGIMIRDLLVLLEAQAVVRDAGRR
jgi:hypothetical protein